MLLHEETADASTGMAVHEHIHIFRACKHTAPFNSSTTLCMLITKSLRRYMPTFCIELWIHHLT